MASVLLFLAGFALGIFTGVMWVVVWIAGLGKPPTPAEVERQTK